MEDGACVSLLRLHIFIYGIFKWAVEFNGQHQLLSLPLSFYQLFASGSSSVKWENITLLRLKEAMSVKLFGLTRKNLQCFIPSLMNSN
jgi:hypothetical protein